jgi:alpha-glucoside transport system substrate-binding protein
VASTARWVRHAAAVAVAIVAAACGGAGGSADRLAGESVEIVAVWQDTDAERFQAVLDRFEDETGADVRYTSTDGEDIGGVLDARRAAGDAPDLAVVPLPGLLRQYASEGVIAPLDDLVGEDAAASYSTVWQELATVDGELFGVWFKAAHKSLIWYHVSAFEDLGAVPPGDLDGLLAVARDLDASGIAPFALAGGDPWTLTDWFENLYLRIAGPDRYDALAERRLPWTDPTVEQALRLMGQLLAPDLVAGGTTGSLDITFPESVEMVSADPPAAAMVAGGDFVAGFVEGSAATLGVDVDAFLFPEVPGSGRLVVGGGDAVVSMRRSAAADALVRYLATAEAGEVWASLGGFLSPNEDVSLASYPDDRTRTIARSLLEAGEGFRFDLSDLQPVEFGGTRDGGMQQILRDFLAGTDDVEGTARRLEAAAAATSGR